VRAKTSHRDSLPFERLESGKTYRSHQVVWRDALGKICRKTFADSQVAYNFAADKTTEIINRGASRRMLSTILDEPVLRKVELELPRLARYDIGTVIDFFLKSHQNPDFKITLSDATVKSLTYQEPRISEASYREFRNTLRNFTNFAGDKFVHEMELETIESFLKSLRARGGIEMAAPKTHENNMISLHCFFGWCVGRPQLFITLNPAEHTTRKYDKAQNEIHSLNAERSEQLMRYLEERYPQLIPRFAIAL
jgi:hypothetical protein